MLPAQTNRTISELTLFTVTNTATDPDLPANTLTYHLLVPPTGSDRYQRRHHLDADRGARPEHQCDYDRGDR